MANLKTYIKRLSDDRYRELLPKKIKMSFSKFLSRIFLRFFKITAFIYSRSW